ncbi:MAG TPA: hypothetical protein VMM78_15160 [Thermomicrobiales bacterium]|nr:hypothetical protein [Thermomicrobiales bacterium]
MAIRRRPAGPYCRANDKVKAQKAGYQQIVILGSVRPGVAGDRAQEQIADQ